MSNFAKEIYYVHREGLNETKYIRACITKFGAIHINLGGYVLDCRKRANLKMSDDFFTVFKEAPTLTPIELLISLIR